MDKIKEILDSVEKIKAVIQKLVKNIFGLALELKNKENDSKSSKYNAERN